MDGSYRGSLRAPSRPGARGRHVAGSIASLGGSGGGRGARVGPQQLVVPDRRRRSASRSSPASPSPTPHGGRPARRADRTASRPRSPPRSSSPRSGCWRRSRSSGRRRRARRRRERRARLTRRTATWCGAAVLRGHYRAPRRRAVRRARRPGRRRARRGARRLAMWTPTTSRGPTASGVVGTLAHLLLSPLHSTYGSFGLTFAPLVQLVAELTAGQLEKS